MATGSDFASKAVTNVTRILKSPNYGKIVKTAPKGLNKATLAIEV
jgi:hypothetical protein